MRRLQEGMLCLWRLGLGNNTAHLRGNARIDATTREDVYPNDIDGRQTLAMLAPTLPTATVLLRVLLAFGPPAFPGEVIAVVPWALLGLFGCGFCG